MKMKRRERLMATIRGETVDRPPVSFYEINGMDEDPDNADPFNIFSHPSWKPLLDLARAKTDRIVMRGVPCKPGGPDPMAGVSEKESEIRNGVCFTTQRIRVGKRTLTARMRRDPDIKTVWTIEHLLKDVDDLRAYLDLPVPPACGQADPQAFLEAEDHLGDTGIVMIDTADPLCRAASLFSMENFTVIAMTEQALFHQLLERFASELLPKTRAVAKALPGRLWRIYGPEYASPPYLPPHLFRDYVCRYVAPMVEAVHDYGGYVRIHSHGNLKAILDDIAAMGVDGLDPIEPPPQGDVELSYVRERHGEQMVLFGNLEASDLENLPSEQFAEKIKRAIEEGTGGKGRGFVLMPSGGPYGRKLAKRTLNNYEKMIEIIESM